MGGAVSRGGGGRGSISRKAAYIDAHAIFIRSHLEEYMAQGGLSPEQVVERMQGCSLSLETLALSRRMTIFWL